MELPPTHTFLRDELLALGVPDEAVVLLGVKPSVLRALPAFWSLSNRLLVINNGEASLFAAALNFRHVRQMLACSPAFQTEADERLFGRQMIVTWPNRKRIVLDGKSNVARGRAALREATA